MEIKPDRISALRRLEEIKSFESSRNYHSGSNNNSQDKLKGIPLKTIAAVAGTIALVIVGGIGFYRWSNSCPAGQQKVNDRCVVEPHTVQENNITNNISQGDNNTSRDDNNISRGERTLFPTIPNQYRDQGIEAFKQGNYEQAVNYFAQAVQYNRNDPEVLIYYNNALARQEGSPFTFAVVVPVGSKQDIAQEILRGVALSQNQFNANGGFNGQLLEIVVANDADKPEEAKKIAQQLVDDKYKSVLAVIGHNTSNATGAAVYEYQNASQPLAIISPTSTNSQLQGTTFFRTVPSNLKEGQQLAEYIRNQLGLTKVVIFYNRDQALFSNDLREQFTKKFEQLGGQVVWNINLTEPKLDVNQKLNESVSQQYQAQAALLFPESQYVSTALEIVKVKANSNNPKVRSLKLLGSSTLYENKTLKEGGNAIEGLILSLPWFREAPQSKNFAQKAAQQWGGKISWSTATSYDATQALIQALSSNPSRATVLQRLRRVNLSPQHTSGNPIQFSPEEEIQMEPVLIKVEKGQFKILQSN
ncbi:MAG: ABC transporter substrate-binding protein [Scytonema sp. CRU_2_7]|nr:ABC transporter substrate-binding protein [Scytonema sp. CRU_2_7]